MRASAGIPRPACALIPWSSQSPQADVRDAGSFRIRRIPETPFASGVLEIPNQFLLFRVNGDHRLVLRHGRRNRLVDESELGVAVGIVGAFARLAIGLQAELLRLQQLADNGVADLVAELVEFGRQPAQALAGPTQRRRGIPACIWLDKCVQIVEQLRIGFGQRFAPASRTTNAARRERIQRFNVFQAASDRARGDARHTRHRGDAAISRGLGFRRSEKPPLPFVEMRQHRRVALLERILIDHPQELRRATPAWNPPSHALKPDPIQLLSDGP